MFDCMHIQHCSPSVVTVGTGWLHSSFTVKGATIALQPLSSLTVVVPDIGLSSTVQVYVILFSSGGVLEFVFHV
jgi:hypothetical protein